MPAMPTLIGKPQRIPCVGNKPKLIDEYIGRVNSATAGVSVAHMRSPEGWTEPGQKPDFDEFTVVLKGKLRVTSKDGMLDVEAGQAVIAHGGEWVQTQPRRAPVYRRVPAGVQPGDGTPGRVARRERPSHLSRAKTARRRWGTRGCVLKEPR